MSHSTIALAASAKSDSSDFMSKSLLCVRNSTKVWFKDNRPRFVSLNALDTDEAEETICVHNQWSHMSSQVEESY